MRLFHLLLGVVALGAFTGFLLSRSHKHNNPVKISVITPTGRREEDTPFLRIKEIVHDLRQGKYIPHISGDREFERLLCECVKPEQESFLEAQAESLRLQTVDQPFEWIVVDLYKEERWIHGSYPFPIKHISEKPSIWHGLKEPEGWEAKVKPPFTTLCNARNTGIIVADGELLVFCDDLTLLTPRVLEVMWDWYEKGYACKGYRHKLLWDEDNSKIIGMYHEYGDFGGYTGAVRTHDWLHVWGHIYSIPLEWELAVNGYDEVLDGNFGAEDIDHGARLRKLYEGKLVLDQRARVYELGGRHMMVGRPHVKDNALLLEVLKGVDCVHADPKANLTRPTKDKIWEYVRYQQENYRRGRIGELMKGKGDRHHPYVFKVCEVPTFDLTELREKYRRGEFAW